MSRTAKDSRARRSLCYWPSPGDPGVSGVWSGASSLANRLERSARRRARRALEAGMEPEPYRPRNTAKWDLY